MRVTVNGEGHEIAESTTVRGLIELLDLAGGPVAVERNGEVVPRAERPAVALAEGVGLGACIARVEIITAPADKMNAITHKLEAVLI